MLTTDQIVFDLAKKSFTTWADQTASLYESEVAIGTRKPIHGWTKPTWETVSKGTRKRYVREATATWAAQQGHEAPQEPQESPAIVETPSAPIEAVQAPEQAAEAV